MKTSLVIFGVVFFVLGIVCYLLPAQTASATVTTVGDGTTDTRTSYTSYTIPWQLTLALVTIGGVLFIMGALIPSPVMNPESIDESEEKVVTGRGKHRRVMRQEHHLHRTTH